MNARRIRIPFEYVSTRASIASCNPSRRAASSMVRLVGPEDPAAAILPVTCTGLCRWAEWRIASANSRFSRPVSLV